MRIQQQLSSTDTDFNKMHRAKIFARCILLGRYVNIRTRSKSLKIVFFCVVGLDIRQYVCALTP